MSKPNDGGLSPSRNIKKEIETQGPRSSQGGKMVSKQENMMASNATVGFYNTSVFGKSSSHKFQTANPSISIKGSGQSAKVSENHGTPDQIYQKYSAVKQRNFAALTPGTLNEMAAYSQLSAKNSQQRGSNLAQDKSFPFIHQQTVTGSASIANEKSPSNMMQRDPYASFSKVFIVPNSMKQ
jgi:hypothetical protein